MTSLGVRFARGAGNRLRALRGAGAALAFASTASAAGQDPCVRLELPAEVPPAWQGALDELRLRVGNMEQAGCTPTRLSVALSGEDGRIVATTVDGRRTERVVRRPEALVSTALGLTAAIPPEQANPPIAAPPPQSAPSPAPAAPASALPSPPAAPGAAAASSPLSLWVGAGAGVRLTAPTSAAAFDVEGRVDLAIGPWLVLATVRSALFSCLGEQGLDCDAYTDVGGGIGLGRRFGAGATSVDMAFEPLVLAMHVEYDAPGEDEGVSVEQTEVALFLDLSARLVVPLGRRWAFTMTVDGAVAPSLLVSPSQVALPAGTSGDEKPLPFPAWIGGVRVGAAGALL